MRALLWFGADDHAYSPKVPLFGGATAVAPSFDDADCMARLACREQHGLKGSTLDFSWDDACWVASSVARLVYLDPSRAAPSRRIEDKMRASVLWNQIPILIPIQARFRPNFRAG